MKTWQKPLAFILLIVLTVFLTKYDVKASNLNDSLPVVRAVMFFSPNCGHCHTVITEVLPPLVDEYGDQLQIIGINTGTSEGQIVYQNWIQAWEIPNNRVGVPTLVVADRYMVGALEIPEEFPLIIENGLLEGGIDWPDIPGFGEVINQIDESHNAPQTTGQAQSINEEITLTDRFKQDLSGNILAVVVLIGMIISVIWILVLILTPTSSFGNDWLWVIPILSVIGLVVAGYLSFVEVTGTEAVCGPIGDCNTVQQSPYAKIFGLLPVGILGLLGYIAILSAWILIKFGPESWHDNLKLLSWGLALFGVIFSIYLTYLEPFVIGATCAWCIASAIIITIQLWAATGPVRQIWAESEDELKYELDDEMDGDVDGEFEVVSGK
jgi:uncharacterized membrane protein/thiol-disulfide isomerase/thioredoxin